MYDLIGTEVEVTADIAGNMTYMQLMLGSQLTLLVCMTLLESMMRSQPTLLVGMTLYGTAV